MAFTVSNWTCVSSSLSQGQQAITPFSGSSTVGNAPNVFMYGSPNDTVATISGANYFLAENASLSVGDWIMGFGTDNSYICQVIASSSTSVTVKSIISGGSGGAPANATYLLQTANGSLPNAQAMGALGTGLLKNTTTTGVQTIAQSPADYYSPDYQYFFADQTHLNLFLSFANAYTPLYTGTNNLFVGTVPPLLTSGSNNVCFGLHNFNNIITGSENSLLGINAGMDLTNNSSNNTLCGYNAGAGISDTSGNTAIGSNAGAGFAGLTSCTFIGETAQATTSNLTNASAIGADSTISISNALNFGNNTAVGFNNPSPAYSIDPNALPSGVGAYAFPISTLPATSATKGTVWMDGSKNLNFTNTSGATVVLNAGTSNIIANVSSNIYNSGGTISLPVSVTGLTSSSIVIAQIQTSDVPGNLGYIVDTTVTTGSFTVKTAAQPISSLVLYYTAFIAPQ